MSIDYPASSASVTTAGRDVFRLKSFRGIGAFVDMFDVIFVEKEYLKMKTSTFAHQSDARFVI
jgi:hypothetical protein